LKLGELPQKENIHQAPPFVTVSRQKPGLGCY
jgi:hypothetical protein